MTGILVVGIAIIMLIITEAFLKGFGRDLKKMRKKKK